MTEEFTIPEWLEPYLDALGGRAEVERLMSDERANTVTNAPLALVQMGMEACITLMHRLHERGMLCLPSAVFATPQEVYLELIGASAQTNPWWKEWDDPYDLYGIDDDRTVPDAWKVTGVFGDPDDDTDKRPFQLTAQSITAALRTLADDPRYRSDFRKQCATMLTTGEGGFDAASGDAVLQYAIVGREEFY